MRNHIQLGAIVLALAGVAAFAGPVSAQAPHYDRPPQARPAPPPPQPHPQNQNHPNVNRPQGNPNANRPANPNQGNGHPPQNNFNNQTRPGNNAQGAGMMRRQPESGSGRPWVDTMRNLTPQQRERVLQNSRAFQNLSPDKQQKIRQQFNQWDHMNAQQRADLVQKERTWRNLTPEQQQHLKNDVWPAWQRMPWDRQQVMKQKLGILQNMPESARNQRLNDPNFTRGMSDDERSMLQDLSHTHIGAPDSPNQ